MDWSRTFEIVLTATLLGGAVGLGVLVFIWARNWRQRLAEDPDSEESIETYRHMLDQGLIAPEEFDRIQARLEGRRPQPTDFRPGPPPPPSEPTP